MPIWEAKRLLGNRLISVNPDHKFYMEMSSRFMNYLKEKVWKIEPFSIDEVFVDVTDIVWNTKDAVWCKDFAEKIKNDILRDVWLPVSVWISDTRIKAKMLSEIRKPLWSCVIFDDDIMIRVLKTLPVNDIPYIWKQSAFRLWKGIITASDFFLMNVWSVNSILWRNGVTLWLELHSVDVWKTTWSWKIRKSIISSRSFNRNITQDRSILWRKILENLEWAYDTLMNERLMPKVIWVHLKDRWFLSQWEFQELSGWTLDRNEITMAAKVAFSRLFDSTKEYRSTWVQLCELIPYSPLQQSVFDDRNTLEDRSIKIWETLINLKKRFWKDIVHVWFSKKVPHKDISDAVLFSVW